MEGKTTALPKIRNKRGYLGILWILPALALMCIFCLYPTINAFLKSFTDWDGVHTPNVVWFENYREVFADKLFWKSLLNVVILTVVGMILGNAASIILAELMYNLHSRMAAVYRFLFVLPAMVPGIIVMLLWQKLIFYGSSGLANSILRLFGHDPISWFTNSNVVIVYLTIFLYGFPWMGGTSFLIYLAGLNGIDESVIDASKLDGLNTFSRIFVIDLPLIKGQLKYFLVMGIIGGLQNYTMQYAITYGGPGGTVIGTYGTFLSDTMVPGYYIYSLLYGGASAYGYACTMGVIMFLIILAITVLNNTVLKSEGE